MLPPSSEPLPLPVDKRVRAVAAGESGAFYTDDDVQGVHVRMLTVHADHATRTPMARADRAAP